MAFNEKTVPITNIEEDVDYKNYNEKYNYDMIVADKVRKGIGKEDQCLDENENISLKSGNGESDIIEVQEDEERFEEKVVGTRVQNDNVYCDKAKNKTFDFLFEYDSKTEEDYDTDLEDGGDITKPYIEEQKEKYINRCKRLGIPPVTIVLNSLTKQKLNLSHKGLGYVGLKAIAPTLKTNTYITELDLQDNNIDEDGMKLIAKTLSENLFINHLDISMNTINNAGLEELLKSLTTNKYVTHLNMSQTGLKDRHADMVSNFIKENGAIKMLILNKNEFSVTGGTSIGNALAINNTISHLDLSWNHIRYAGATAIGQALKLNSSLITINIAWNGFADNGAEAIAKALLTNDSLQELDVSYNRISDKGSTALADSLKVNKAIRVLRMNWNAIRSDGVSALVNGIDKNDHAKIVELHLNGVVINGVCKAEMDALLQKRQQLRIHIGGVTNSTAMATNMNKIRREIVEIISAYLSTNRLRMLDLFNQWDKDKSLTLTRNEFRKGIKSCKIPISEVQLYFMLEWLDQDGNDEIEYNEFVAITEVE